MQTAKLLKKEIKNKKIGSGNVMLSEPRFFFTNYYRNGYRSYRFYRCGTVAVTAGQNL
jgi:hypothetical protein